MGRRFNLTLLLGLLSFTTGCSSVLYVRNPGSRVYADPSYEISKPFFFFGLVGPDQHVFVNDVCLGKAADQIVTQYTGGDALNSIFTLGIYTPRTVKVWCTL